MATDDLTMETLLAVREELSPGVDETLLRRCYLVQKQFQFSDDRALAAAEMEKLIDAHVKSIISDLT